MLKKIIPIIVIVLSLVMVVFSFRPVNMTTPSRKAETPLLGKGGEENPLPQRQTPSVQKTIPQNKNISVSFVVRQATSTIQVLEGSSVYDAMSALASTTSLRFGGIYYSGMGYYINEINGEKNRNNAFWIYYVNGAEANIGASYYILKNGDTIVWRLEDSAKKEVGIQ